MQAIEFNAILHQGTVTIPPQYSSQWEGKNIRVIFLEESEADLTALTDQPDESNSLFSRLRQIKISAPSDFSENLDAYLNGEKYV